MFSRSIGIGFIEPEARAVLYSMHVSITITQRSRIAAGHGQGLGFARAQASRWKIFATSTRFSISMIGREIGLQCIQKDRIDWETAHVTTCLTLGT